MSLVLYLGDEDCIEKNVGYPGNDIRTIDDVGHWRDCRLYCQGTTECKFWSMSLESNTCSLKTSDAGRKAQMEIISGTKDCHGMYIDVFSFIYKETFSRLLRVEIFRMC